MGAGAQGISLDDPACGFLLSTIASDLGLEGRVAGLPPPPFPFFASVPVEHLRIPGVDVLGSFERLLGLDQNVDTYFACLAALHKARLKYERILQTQPFPTIDQVGPRALLQFGSISPRALLALLIWRKWMFDIDNRAGQETGYLFEPIIANAIGGVPASSRKSPIRRRDKPGEGRQVDCLRGNNAYEFKLRVTIAASGQGRWREELDFPADCVSSGYVPVLIVLDPTPNRKLTELTKAFVDQRGEVYIGAEAWRHLEALAGETMANFLRRYVHTPLDALLAEVPLELPDLSLSTGGSTLAFRIGEQQFAIERKQADVPPDAEGALPDDVDEQVPGP